MRSVARVTVLTLVPDAYSHTSVIRTQDNNVYTYMNDTTMNPQLLQNMWANMAFQSQGIPGSSKIKNQLAIKTANQ